MTVARLNSGGGHGNGVHWGVPMTDVISELEARVSVLEDYIAWDEELRKTNPVLQDLFEKFQTTKNLIK